MAIPVLPVPGGPINKMLSALQELQVGEAIDLCLVDTRLAFKREGVERPLPRQMRVIEAVGEPVLASRRGFFAKQPIEELAAGRASCSARSISASSAAPMPWNADLPAQNAADRVTRQLQQAADLAQAVALRLENSHAVADLREDHDRYTA